MPDFQNLQFLPRLFAFEFCLQCRRSSSRDSRATPCPPPARSAPLSLPRADARLRAMEAAAAEPKVDGVRVAVRVRPLNARESARAADSPLDWRVGPAEIAQAVSGRAVPANTFAFDHVFGQAATNGDVFAQLAQPVVAAALDGYNATIFAYGQTSSGKTHSMLGSEADPGVTRRSIADVFERVGATPDRQFLLRASYIEIYQEVIRDLLEPAHDNLKIHEDLNRRVYVEAREEVVSSVEEVMAMIAAGESVRAVGETQMNDRSSRSHTIFTLLIESREVTSGEVVSPDAAVVAVGEDGAPAVPLHDGVAVRASSLSLVDLAGSERAALTGAEGVRLKEGSHINKSLLTLGNVINKLSSAEPGSTAHIPYRDSKLTRILQPALGGNARTAILCAVTPAIMHMEETLSTLKFASRAKKVKNRTQCNEYLDDTAKLRRCERQLAQLKKQLAAAQSGAAVRPSDIEVDSPSRDVAAASASEEAAKAAAEQRVRAFQGLFAKMAAKQPTPASDCVSEAGRRQPSHSSSRHALDLAVRPRRVLSSRGTDVTEDCAGADDVSGLPEGAEAEMANLRRSLFSSEQAQTRMRAEIEYERSALSAEMEMLSEVAEEANRSRNAAEDECSTVRTALARANAGAYVDEIVTAAMLMSDSNKALCASEARVSFLEPLESKLVTTQDKLKALEKDLSEARKREKRGVGPVLKEVSTLKSKLADSENKVKSNKQTSSKIASEKAAIEKEMIAKMRQIKVLEAEVQKYRKNESNANARLKGDFEVERKKWDVARAEIEAQALSLKEKLALAETASADLRSSVSDLEDRTVMLKEEKEKLEHTDIALKKAFDATEVELKCEIAALNDKLTAAEDKTKEIQGTVTELEAEKEILSTEATGLNEELALTKTKLAEVQKQVMEKESSLKAVKAELLSVTEVAASAELVATEKVEELEKAISSSKQDAAEAKKQLDELGGELATLHMSTETVKAEQNETQRLLEEARGSEELMQERAKVLESETTGLQKRVEEFEHRTAVLTKQLDETLTKNASLQSELLLSKTEGQKLAENAQAGAASAATRTDEVNARLEACQSELSATKKERDDAQRRVDALSERVSEISAASCVECAKLSAQVNELQQVHKKASHELKEQKEGVRKARLALETENKRLEAEVARESCNGSKLLEKVYTRDTRITELEDKLAEYRRGGGAIRRLEDKLQRRDATVEQLRSVLDANVALIKEGGLGDQWAVAERAANAEAELASLRVRLKEYDSRLSRLEDREAAGKEERLKLRQEIKARDLAKEKVRAERLQHALKENKANP